MSENIQASAAPEATQNGTQELNNLSIDDLNQASESNENQQLADAEADLQNAESNQEVKEAEKKIKQLKKLKLKVDGEEEDYEYDPDDEENLRKQFQLAKVSQKRMSEYAQLEKDVRDFVEALKSDPKSVLKDPTIGIDLKKLAQAVIEEEIENSKKSPDQIAREKMEAELRSLKEEREKEREEQRNRELKILEEKEAQKYDTMITQALNTEGLPKSPYIVKKIADYMALGLENNIDLNPADVIPLVREEVFSDIKQMFNVLPDNVVEEIIGKDTLTRIRKSKVAAAKNTPNTTKSIKETGTKVEKKDSSTPKTFKDFFGV